MNTTDAIINAESGGDPDAKNPNSSASGPGQFIDSTWLATLKAHRPDLASGASDADLLALKNDPSLSRDMTAAYAADNGAILSKAGLPVTPGTTYLAHFAGPSGAVKVLQADPGASASDILGPAALKANPFLAGMTAQGLRAWAAKKVGATAPSAPGVQQQQAATAQEAPPAPTPQPLAAPAQAAPIFAPQPAVDAPAPTPQQIFIPPRKPIDLSGLKAALAARAPIFANQQQGS